MKKYIAWTLILVTLLLAACRPVGTQPTDPDNIVGTATPTTQPTKPQPTEPQPTEPKPTEPKPTEPKPTEPKPTEPKFTEPKPTEPQLFDPTLPLPDEFPADLLTDAVTLSVFQKFFDENNYARQASGKYFEDPTKINLHGFFYAIGMVDDIPVTEEDRKAIVDKSGVESFYDRKAYCLSAEKMNQVLLQSFGVPLSEMTGFANLYYLESSGNYCYFHNDSPPVAKTGVMGVRFLEDGNAEVYYVAIRAKENYPRYYGVITVKSVENTYHILSNEHIDVWPEPGHVPEIPEGAPADLNTDPDVVKKYQNLLDNDSWYTQALFMEYDDPLTIRLNDFLFCGSMNWPYEHATKEEREALRKQLGVSDEEEWWGDWESMDPATMDEVLQTVFGLSLADFPESELQYIPFLESTGRYYYGRTDSSLVRNVSVAGVRELENGNVEVYYTGSYVGPEEGYVTLKPMEGGYRVISNTCLKMW